MNGFRELRMTRGLSQAELARRARIHPAEISRFETGHAIPYPRQARRLARILSVGVEDLLALLRAELRERASNER